MIIYNLFSTIDFNLDEFSDIQTAETYGEPGYTLEEGAPGIMFANWNNIKKEFQDAAECLGWEMEWSDEWIIARSNGSTAYRKLSDSHHWKPYYLVNDWTNEEIMGGDEIKADPTDYVEEYLLNNPHTMDIFDIDLTKLGFTLVDDSFESGFHPGQNADPSKILASAPKGYDYVFQIGGIGQFDVAFRLYARAEEA